MKTLSNIGWAIYSPISQKLILSTVDRRRGYAMAKAGCKNSANWKEMYRIGFRAKKVSIKEIN